jgi:hypothetical protein
MLSLTDAFQSFYTYIISIAGVVALAALLIGGILYLTSTGEPEKLDKARKQILAAFFGIIILFSSYLILRAINPELVSFEISELKKIIFHPLDAPPPETSVPELLGGVGEIAKQLKENIIPGTELVSQNIKNLTDNCDCSNTQPLCYCTGGSSDDSCQPRSCYAGPGSHPCPGESGIKDNQQRVIAWKDEIIYYRNRALSEEQDLQDEIKKVLDEEILYYIKREQIEEDEEVKQYLREKRQEVTDEKNLKKELAVKLEELADLTEKISAPLSKIGTLPDQCLVNVKNCNSSCIGECHDHKDGCRPYKCGGGNPCPTSDIQTRFNEIQQLKPSIVQVCDEILNIINEIIELKTVII